MTIRRFLCAVLGGHDLGIVPVWRDGKARLACQYNCGYFTEGIAVPKHSAPRKPVVRRYPPVMWWRRRA